MGRVAFDDHVNTHTFDAVEAAVVEAEAEAEIVDDVVNIYPYENDRDNHSWAGALPKKQGLYDPELEKDACGVGFAAHIKGKASHKIITDGANALDSLLENTHHTDSRCDNV